MGLGKNADYFDSWFAEECSSVWRGIHYKPRPADQLLDDARLSKLTAPEHRDSGFITLLTTFMYPGLQVEYDGKFRDVKGMKNAIVVNLGATLQRISNFKIKATMHRVLDIGRDRFSSPYFFEPKLSARITTNILESERKYAEDIDYDLNPKNRKEVQSTLTYGEFSLTRIGQYGEWKGFKAPKISFDFKAKYGLDVGKKKIKLENILQSEK